MDRSLILSLGLSCVLLTMSVETSSGVGPEKPVVEASSGLDPTKFVDVAALPDRGTVLFHASNAEEALLALSNICNVAVELTDFRSIDHERFERAFFNDQEPTRSKNVTLTFTENDFWGGLVQIERAFGVHLRWKGVKNGGPGIGGIIMDEDARQTPDVYLTSGRFRIVASSFVSGGNMPSAGFDLALEALPGPKVLGARWIGAGWMDSRDSPGRVRDWTEPHWFGNLESIHLDQINRSGEGVEILECLVWRDIILDISPGNSISIEGNESATTIEVIGTGFHYAKQKPGEFYARGENHEDAGDFIGRIIEFGITGGWPGLAPFSLHDCGFAPCDEGWLMCGAMYRDGAEGVRRTGLRRKPGDHREYSVLFKMDTYGTIVGGDYLRFVARVPLVTRTTFIDVTSMRRTKSPKVSPQTRSESQ